MTAAVESIQLRCRSKLQGILRKYAGGQELLEVRCKDKWCADRGEGHPKMVVLHYFTLDTGELHHTTKYREPKRHDLDERKVDG